MSTPVEIAVELHSRLAQTEIPAEFQLAAYPTLLQYQLAGAPPSTDHAPTPGPTSATDLGRVPTWGAPTPAC